MGEDTAGAKTQPVQGTKCPKCLLYKLHSLQTPRCSHQHPSALRRLGSIHPKPITAHPRGADSTLGTRSLVPMGPARDLHAAILRPLGALSSPCVCLKWSGRDLPVLFKL